MSTIHACPPDGESVMPCCGRTPFDVSRGDRLTCDDTLATCGRTARETMLQDQLRAAEAKAESCAALASIYREAAKRLGVEVQCRWQVEADALIVEHARRVAER